MKISKKSAFWPMVDFVNQYLEGEMDRLEFDLDFICNLEENYPKMQKENRELAEFFHFRFAERGLDRADGLCDDKHKDLIEDQWDDFVDAMENGLF